MRGILQSWGCQVETAASGDAALAALSANGGKPDLIISDYRLADGATGIDAIELLRAAAGAPIPAFVITGDTAPSTCARPAPMASTSCTSQCRPWRSAPR
jgi:CheY-like chemotaxis protein